MVRAILAGQKTVTRRTVRDVPQWVARTGPDPFGATLYSFNADRIEHVRSPYGIPGDRLWVRETWRPDSSHDPDDTRYRADYQGNEYNDVRDMLPWRPSIFMPRTRSRITLEVVNIRVERLHAITEEDAIREGVDAVSVADVPRNGTLSRRDDFAQLWQKINGKRAPWGSNPFVWRIEFRRVEVHRG